MDDLTLFIAHKKSDCNLNQDNNRIIEYVANNVYKGGLEAEIQEPAVDNETRYMHEFAGHELHTNKDLSDIYVRTLNVNRESVKHNRTQKKVRYPNMHTYMSRHSKIGNIIGSIRS